MTKIRFCLMLKALWLDKKVKLISKPTPSHAGELIMTTHILPNISRIEDHETMKFVQLIGYDIKN